MTVLRRSSFSSCWYLRDEQRTGIVLMARVHLIYGLQHFIWFYVPSLRLVKDDLLRVHLPSYTYVHTFITCVRNYYSL
nr:unnamed protein product [Callosobruchus analis]